MKTFDINKVTLKDGEFKRRQDLVRKFLAGFDLDRLMYTFRTNAGIPTDAEPLPSWEQPSFQVRGQFAGHFLSACAKYAYCGDEVLKKKADDVVDIMEECAFENGFLSAFGEIELDNLEKYENHDVWAPYYVLHKIMAGLIAAYKLIGNEKALRLAINLARYIYGRFEKLPEDKIDRMLNCGRLSPANEFGGIGDALYSLYEITKEDFVLSLAKIFDREYFTGELAKGNDVLTDKHANTHIPQITSALHRYSLFGEESFLTAGKNFYSFLKMRTFANGNSSSRACNFVKGEINERTEHWSDEHLTHEDLTGEESESCCGHNTENVLSYLIDFDEDNRLEYLTHLETLKYNSVLNCASRKTGLSVYHQPMGKDVKKKFSIPMENFWCCTGSGVEAMSEVQKDIFFEDGDTVFVNMFVPSVLDLGGTSLTLDTSFPEETDAKITVKADGAVRIAFRKGCAEEIKINGKPAEVTSSAYADTVKAEDGDAVTLKITAEVTENTMHDDETMHFLKYGPVLLAKISGEFTPGDKAEKHGLTFSTEKAVFIPFYMIEDETYTVYM